MTPGRRPAGPPAAWWVGQIGPIGRTRKSRQTIPEIGLPANLFYGTGIPACIMVIDKENAHARTGIFVIDARKGFLKDGNKNRLRAQDIHKIVDVFNRQVEMPRYSRMVPVSEIANQPTTTTSTSRATSIRASRRTCRTSTRT